MIDLHSHVLPGIDDGPATMDGSVELARAVAAVGIRTLLATPHVSGRHRNDAATIGRLVRETSARLGEEGVALELLPGAELAIMHVPEIEPDELARLGLGGGPWLLVEPPFTELSTGVQPIVHELMRAGHRVLLAHPERCPAFQRDPRLLQSLIEDGALTSLTAGSLVGRFGGLVRRFALALMERGLVHNVSSDAHDLTSRAPGIARELEQAGYGHLREWLAEEVPAAILAGEQIPPRPALAVPRPRRLRWLRRA